MKQSLLAFFMLLSFSKVFSQAMFYGDTISFDGIINYVRIDTSSSCLWQIGKPQKTIFNQAFTPQRAIVTDTINSYTTNNHSYFDVFISQANDWFFPYSIFLEFKHKIDSDTLKDGGYITVSNDMGITWYNIIDNSLFSIDPFWTMSNTNIYLQTDSLINNQFGFSGTNNAWRTTIVGWPGIGVKSNQGDTIIFRFNFISDSIDTHKEGWMIDNIRIYASFSGGLAQNNNSSITNVQPNPFQNSTRINLDNNYENITASIYNLNGKEIKAIQSINKNYITIDRGEMLAGVYYCRINTNNKQCFIKKLVIID